MNIYFYLMHDNQDWQKEHKKATIEFDLYKHKNCDKISWF